MSIIVDNLSFSYFEDGKPILEELSIEIPKDKITILTGLSGCGKSTFLFTAAGLYPENGGYLKSGTISMEGQNPAQLSPPERAKLCSMMFQNPDLQFCMDTLWNELVFCLENVQEDPSEISGIADEAMEFCDIAHLKDRELNSLSGGEKQKAMLACMVALDPEWMLLDEPFANIDDESAREITEKLVKLHQERGTGILAVDHRLENWLDFADEIRLIRDGKVISEHILVKPLGEMRGYLTKFEYPQPGIPYKEAINDENPSNSEVVLEIKDLTVSYNGRPEPVLNKASASFKKGNIYALVGRSGAGKSSFFGALTGLNKYSGKILLEGRDISKRRERKKAGEIGFVTQSPQDQFIGGTVKNEILAALKKRPDAEAKAEEILRSIKLWRYRDISPYMLSQGQQRRLGVSALLTYPCKVLLCDEPTYAQDRSNTIAIMDALTDAVKSMGIVMIFSTHDMQLAKDYADVVMELKGGKLNEKDKSIL